VPSCKTAAWVTKVLRYPAYHPRFWLDPCGNFDFKLRISVTNCASISRNHSSVIASGTAMSLRPSPSSAAAPALVATPARAGTLFTVWHWQGLLIGRGRHQKKNLVCSDRIDSLRCLAAGLRSCSAADNDVAVRAQNTNLNLNLNLNILCGY